MPRAGPLHSSPSLSFPPLRILHHLAHPSPPPFSQARYAAGEGFPSNPDVFHSPALAKRYEALWTHLARSLVSMPNIAGYEVPRGFEQSWAGVLDSSYIGTVKRGGGLRKGWSSPDPFPPPAPCARLAPCAPRLGPPSTRIPAPAPRLEPGPFHPTSAQPTRTAYPGAAFHFPIACPSPGPSPYRCSRSPATRWSLNPPWRLFIAVCAGRWRRSTRERRAWWGRRPTTRCGGGKEGVWGGRTG
jgi:hypothetical protein